MGSEGAVCDKFLTMAPRDIPKPSWDLERYGAFCMKAEDFTNIKIEIEKLCSMTACTWQVPLKNAIPAAAKAQEK